ncbi:fumarylacetoacetate hydrolase family protein [Pseudonocardia nematodicida]|uniref:Fumarylacetoacetate hydrolase family protein n=1 Tax=Pseudonocardia nematodicida TaxID=1206997 RepID=A0ABV1KGA3_9PSEU
MRIARAVVAGRPATVVDDGEGWRISDVPIAELIAGTAAVPTGDPLRLDPAGFLLPYRPSTIIGVGLNFADTVADMGWATPTAPYLFPKLSSSVIGPSDPVVVDLSVTTRADWEAELGVVIGRRTRSVTADEALEHVFGYVAANDVSARDLQAQDGQWLRGKGLDTFCPLGPWVASRDEIADESDVAIRTWYDGRLVQDGSTASMIFGVAELVSYCSTWFTLEPGDLILTGTPAGCGDFRTPREALVPGGTVEIEVAGLGRQRNPVHAPA